jgi:hypothetical protein
LNIMIRKRQPSFITLISGQLDGPSSTLPFIRYEHGLWMPRDTIYIGIREDFYFYVGEGELGSRPPNPNAHM